MHSFSEVINPDSSVGTCSIVWEAETCWLLTPGEIFISFNISISATVTDEQGELQVHHQYVSQVYLYWLPLCSTFSMSIRFRVNTRGCALGHFKAYIFPLVFSWIALQNTVNLPFASEQILFWNLSPHRHGSLLPSVSGCQASQHLWCIILFFSSGQAHVLVTESKHIVWHHSTCPSNLSSQPFVR